jgi:hypothetical protein
MTTSCIYISTISDGRGPEEASNNGWNQPFASEKFYTHQSNPWTLILNKRTQEMSKKVCNIHCHQTGAAILIPEHL